MARRALDITDVYRFKVTHTFIADRDSYGRTKGQEYEEVEFIGPYTRKIPWNGWVPNYGTLLVERQQLVAYLESPEEGAKLTWHTIESKRYKNGEPVL